MLLSVSKAIADFWSMSSDEEIFDIPPAPGSKSALPYEPDIKHKQIAVLVAV